MKKHKYLSFAVLLIFLISISGVVGCGNSTSYIDSTFYNTHDDLYYMEYMECVAEHQDQTEICNYFYFYRNTITDVMYIYCDGYKSGGFVEMTHPETGLPLTYKQFQELSH